MVANQGIDQGIDQGIEAKERLERHRFLRRR
jgi:hypothetical protein